MDSLRELLIFASERAADYRENVAEAPVFPTDADLSAIRSAIGALPAEPVPAGTVVTELAAAIEPALVSSAGPRYFGFVTGAALDAPTAMEVLATGWDQNGYNAVTSPAAALVEDIAGEWLKDVLGLPSGASFGFVTGGQGANSLCLAAARHWVLEAAGWDVERDGLSGSPRIRVVANGERHATIDRSVRLLGLGSAAIEPVATTESGAIDTASLATVLERGSGPAIVCLQAGNVNSGAFDDFTSAIEIAHCHGAWAHVDGAFGLWAAASPILRTLVAGMELADSWATDGHKWLNIPYDGGYGFCAHPAAHAAATAYSAAYLSQSTEGLRSPGDYLFESSRRARGFATYAALRQLGRSGIADLVDRCCALARRFAAALDAVDGVSVVNEVQLNQVLVSFGDDARTDRVIAAVQDGGECWMGGTSWHGRRLMRISVSSWSTTEADVDRSVRAIRSALENFPHCV